MEKSTSDLMRGGGRYLGLMVSLRVLEMLVMVTERPGAPSCLLQVPQGRVILSTFTIFFISYLPTAQKRIILMYMWMIYR